MQEIIGCGRLMTDPSTTASSSSNKKTLYQILGVEHDATLVEIQVAHQELLDAEEGALDQADQVAIKEAYRTLSDARRRAAYDQSLRGRELAPATQIEDEDQDSGLGKKLLIALAVALLVGAVWFMKRPDKPASRPAVPSATLGASAPSQATAGPVAAPPPPPETLLFGTWRCQGPLTGNGLEMRFASDGTYSGQTSGQALAGDYKLTGATLTFRDAEQSNSFTVEELAQQRLVIRRGEGKRLTCSR
ncbi:MAG TPA: hypothetical protein VHQ87_19315 [Rhizobacter sp.]|nr:hypothetical protein [Rhizobacter sp.]